MGKLRPRTVPLEPSKESEASAVKAMGFMRSDWGLCREAEDWQAGGYSARLR